MSGTGYPGRTSCSFIPGVADRADINGLAVLDTGPGGFPPAVGALGHLSHPLFCTLGGWFPVWSELFPGIAAVTGRTILVPRAGFGPALPSSSGMCLLPLGYLGSEPSLGAAPSRLPYEGRVTAVCDGRGWWLIPYPCGPGLPREVRP